MLKVKRQGNDQMEPDQPSPASFRTSTTQVVARSLLHVVVGLVLFALIATAAYSISLLRSFIDAPSIVENSLRAVEYLTLALDVLCLTTFLAKEVFALGRRLFSDRS